MAAAEHLLAVVDPAKAARKRRLRKLLGDHLSEPPTGGKRRCRRRVLSDASSSTSGYDSTGTSRSSFTFSSSDGDGKAGSGVGH